LLLAGCASSPSSEPEPAGPPPEPPDVRFRIVATQGEVPGPDPLAEMERVRSWLEANPGSDLMDFNALPPTAGGPPTGIDYARKSPGSDEFVGLLAPPFDVWDFRLEDLEGAAILEGDGGRSSLTLRMVEHRRADFARFTGANKGRVLAIVVDGEVWSAPVIQERIPGLFALAVEFGSGGAEAFARSLGLPPLAIEAQE
jgi:hypothetical protein